MSSHAMPSQFHRKLSICHIPGGIGMPTDEWTDRASGYYEILNGMQDVTDRTGWDRQDGQTTTINHITRNDAQCGIRSWGIPTGEAEEKWETRRSLFPTRMHAGNERQTQTSRRGGVGGGSVYVWYIPVLSSSSPAPQMLAMRWEALMAERWLWATKFQHPLPH